MTEKKVWTLKVDGELRGLIPPLSAEERKMLEESIVRDGCDTPLTVWEGTIVDGHNRYDICREHGILMGIITVPAEHAQKVCDRMVAAGIKVIWNFASVHLTVPGGIVVQNENLAASLTELRMHLRAQLHEI